MPRAHAPSRRTVSTPIVARRAHAADRLACAVLLALLLAPAHPAAGDDASIGAALDAACPMDALLAEAQKTESGSSSAGGTCPAAIYKPADAYGEIKVLVVFVKFADDASEFPCSDAMLGPYGWPSTLVTLPGWSDSLIAKTRADAVIPGRFGQGGVTHYYFDNSSGRYALYGDVYPKLVIPPGTSADYVGTNNWEALNSQILRAIDTDSIDAAHPHGIDFADYDRFPQDGVVDLVILLVRRFPNAATKMPHASGAWKGIAWTWAPYACQHDVVTNDATIVGGEPRSVTIEGTSGVTCEVDGAFSSVEMIAHEVGHQILGSATFFKMHEEHLGGFSLMDGGHLVSANDRERLGWQTPVVVTSDAVGLRIDPFRSGADPGTLVKIPLDDVSPSDEFLLVENRQGLSLWEQYQATALPRAARCGYPIWTGFGGLVVTHVKGTAHDRAARVESAQGAFDLKTNKNPDFQRPNPVAGAGPLDRQLPYGNANRPGQNGAAWDLYSEATGTALAPYTVPSTDLWEWEGPGKSTFTGRAMLNVRRAQDDATVVLADFALGAPQETIDRPTVWSGWVTLGRDVTVAPGGSLTVQPSATVLAPYGRDFGAGGSDPARVEIVAAGGAFVAGAPESPPARFLSSATSDVGDRSGSYPTRPPAPGDWGGLRCAGDAEFRLAGVRIAHAAEGVRVAAGAPEAFAATIDACDIGIVASAGGLRVTESTITNCVGDGIVLDDVRATVARTRVEAPGDAAVRVAWGAQGVEVLLDRLTLVGGDYGLVVESAPGSADAHVRCTNGSFDGSDRAAVRVSNAAGRVVLRSNTIWGDSAGVVIDAGSLAPDLGAPGAPGRNCFGGGLDLYVVNESASLVTARGNHWGPFPGIVAHLTGAVDYLGALTVCDVQEWAGDATTDVASASDGGPSLGPAAPNPTRGRTRLRYRVPSAAGPVAAEIAVFDASGRRVRTLVSGRGPAGGVVEWDGRDVSGRLAPAGVYVVRLASPGSADAGVKVTLVR
jgi:M6 family metalloprotease-like protein